MLHVKSLTAHSSTERWLHHDGRASPGQHKTNYSPRRGLQLKDSSLPSQTSYVCVYALERIGASYKVPIWQV